MSLRLREQSPNNEDFSWRWKVSGAASAIVVVFAWGTAISLGNRSTSSTDTLIAEGQLLFGAAQVTLAVALTFVTAYYAKQPRATVVEMTRARQLAMTDAIRDQASRIACWIDQNHAEATVEFVVQDEERQKPGCCRARPGFVASTAQRRPHS